MNILVAVKRVPDTGAKFALTPDQRAIETRNLGFTISPHEECAVEEAVRLVESQGGSGTALTLGPPDAEEQIRDCLARGMERGILLETKGEEWDPVQTASAIAEAVRSEKNAGNEYDLLLFGNESADSGGYQVAPRVAHTLDWPCVCGVKSLELRDGVAVAKREIPTGWEVFELPLPAVIAVKEGINLPRHPSLRGTMKAKKKKVERLSPRAGEATLEMLELKHPPEQGKEAQMLGEGAAAAPAIVDVLKGLELI